MQFMQKRGRVAVGLEVSGSLLWTQDSLHPSDNIPIPANGALYLLTSFQILHCAQRHLTLNSKSIL